MSPTHEGVKDVCGPCFERNHANCREETGGHHCACEHPLKLIGDVGPAVVLCILFGVVVLVAVMLDG